jgi:hypothetical protein
MNPLNKALTPEQQAEEVNGIRRDKRCNVVPESTHEPKDKKLSLWNIFFGTSKDDFSKSLENFTLLWGFIRIPKRFQRLFVKTIQQQQQIVKAMLMGELHDPLYFAIQRLKQIFEAVDGQQRITSMGNWIKGLFVLPNGTIIPGLVEGTWYNASGMSYEDLKKELNGEVLVQQLLQKRKLNVVFIEGDENYIRRWFRNLNVGQTPLKAIEILLSYGTKVFEYLRDINTSMKDTWEKLGIDNLRFKPSELVLNLYIQLYKSNGVIGKINKKMRDEMADYTDSVSTEFKNYITTIQKFVKNIPLNRKGSYNWGKIRLLIHWLHDIRSNNEILITDYKKFNSFVYDMYKNTRIRMDKVLTIRGNKWDFEIKTQNSEFTSELIGNLNFYLDVQLSKIGGATQEGFTKFEEQFGLSIRTKDRNVKWSERIDVLDNTNHKCAECGEDVGIHDDVHHIEEYAKHGGLDVKKMIVMHRECHIKKHKEMADTSKENLDDDSNE